MAHSRQGCLVHFCLISRNGTAEGGSRYALLCARQFFFWRAFRWRQSFFAQPGDFVNLLSIAMHVPRDEADFAARDIEPLGVSERTANILEAARPMLAHRI